MREEMGNNMALNSEGVPYSPDYERFTGELGGGMSYSAALQMYIQEHGSPAWQIPPRPIIEPAIEDPENKEKITEQLSLAVEAALDGNSAAMNAQLNNAGLLAQNIVRDWFTNPKNLWTPNAPLTVKLKGSDKPLIDTGNLRKAISYVIREKG
jgi:hypothetical protein